jgi:hypothetical protein
VSWLLVVEILTRIRARFAPMEKKESASPSRMSQQIGPRKRDWRKGVDGGRGGDLYLRHGAMRSFPQDYEEGEYDQVIQINKRIHFGKGNAQNAAYAGIFFTEKNNGLFGLVQINARLDVEDERYCSAGPLLRRQEHRRLRRGRSDDPHGHRRSVRDRPHVRRAVQQRQRNQRRLRPRPVPGSGLALPRPLQRPLHAARNLPKYIKQRRSMRTGRRRREQTIRTA